METFRREVLDTKPYIDSQRALIVTKSYKENQNMPKVMQRSLMLKDILEEMTIFIEDKTLIVGNQAQANRNAPIYPEYTMDFVINELDLFEKRDGDVFYIEEQTKKDLRSIKSFWDKNNLRSRGDAFFPDEVKVFMEAGFFGMEGKLNSGAAHIVADYQGLLDQGLLGYEERCKKLKSDLDLTKPESLNKYQFYKAVLIVIEAVKNFAGRYANLARELAESADEARKKELLEIAEICDHVPYKKPRNFREAVQAVWFIQLILQIESNGHSLSFGRFDQYINPFLEKDLNQGKITEDEAVELFTNLWVKAMTINKVRSQAHTYSSAGSPMYQNVTIGGQTPDGKDAVNTASFLVLKSVAQARMPQPNLTVRYHRNINQDFFDQALEVVKIGFGMPAFNSDEVIIPSFIEKGVKKEDAYNYTAVGCVETAVPGKWGYRCTGMSYLNLPRTLLIAMNNGIDPTSGKRFCKDYGNFIDMENFDDLMYAVKETVKELTRASVIIENAVDLVSSKEVPDILCSTLTQDCLGRGTTIKEGGAIYDYISGLQVGIADMADSLAAIKYLVFEEGKISKEDLKQVLDQNFQGAKNEDIRTMLINQAPKYGNDIDYVDNLVVEVYEAYLEELKNYPNTRYGKGPIGGIRYGGTSSISANVGQGLSTMATPNGRYAKTPLAEGCSPAHSMDTSGPTAVYKSVSKLPTHDITGGVLLNQKISPKLVETTEGKKKLEMLIRTFFNRLDGYHVQYNIIDRDTLIDAQKHPDKHKDLIVRVAGYSAFFNVLSKATQDDIIGRTEQTL
jgi:pyruvate formate-lyase/glycerol dehydratase family glycyl radical enzyme